MDRAAALIPRPRLHAAAATAAALALAAAAALAGCGGSSGSDATAAQQLGTPGAKWSGLSKSERHLVLHACRLQAAIGLAAGADAASMPRSSAFRAVLQLPMSDLRDALDQRFADPAHASEPVGRGCADVLGREIAAAGIGTAPRADFGPPVVTSSEGLRLPVEGTSATFTARITPAGASLAIGDAPGRAPSSVHVAIQRRGDAATVHLRGVPLGRSYLSAVVRAGGRTWRRLISISGHRASPLPAPRTFAPMVLHGTDASGIPLLYVPRDARATVTTDGSPLTLSSGWTVLLAHALGQPTTTAQLPAGRYEDVRVRARGDWSIRIVPAR